MYAKFDKPVVILGKFAREELNAILAVAKAARDEAPWDMRTHQYHRVVFPQMSNWLPAEEAESLRQQFRLDLERIDPLVRAAA